MYIFILPADTSISNTKSVHLDLQACVVADGGQEMTCSGPLLTEFSGLSSADLQAHDKPIIAHITFKMDGLLLPRPINGKPAHFTFTYRLELCVARFPDEGIAVDFWHPEVEIKVSEQVTPFEVLCIFSATVPYSYRMI